jgi:hypothetical protein
VVDPSLIFSPETRRGTLVDAPSCSHLEIVSGLVEENANDATSGLLFKHSLCSPTSL